MVSSSLLSSSKPEIEDVRQLRSVLESPDHFSSTSSFDLLDTGNTQKRWTADVGDEELRKAIQDVNAKKELSLRTRVFFLTLQPDKKATKELQISSSGFRSIVETFAIPHTFVEGIFKDQIWNGNGCFLGQTSDGLPGKFELFYRSECGWHPHIQTAFVADFAANTATYLIIDCPEKVRDRIRNGIRSNPRLLDRPLVLDALLLDECLKAWNDKVNQYRRRLLEYEHQSRKDDRTAASEDSDTDDATNTLHKLCSKTHRMFEHLADLEGCGKFLRESHQRYVDAIQESNNGWPLDWQSSVRDSFTHLLSGVDTCKRWTDNYRSRTHLYENMLWHADVQSNNAVNKRIAETTKDDSKAMIALSTLAMLFLPGTFVAGIFSMAFFTSPTAQDFKSSKWIWLYFAVTIPLTAGSFVACSIWKRRGRDAESSASNLEQARHMNDRPLCHPRSRAS